MSSEINYESCCGVLGLEIGIYCIALHSIFHGFILVCFFVTTYHSTYYLPLNISAIVTHALYIPVGLYTFWCVIHRNWKNSIANSVLIFILAIANICTSFAYFVIYFPFEANSLLDKTLFWVNPFDWMTSSDIPFTVWHAISLINCLTTFSWIYYGYILARYGFLLKRESRKSSTSTV